MFIIKSKIYNKSIAQNILKTTTKWNMLLNTQWTIRETNFIMLEYFNFKQPRSSNIQW